jgi:4-hydroxyacetophenone monooxygenase
MSALEQMRSERLDEMEIRRDVHDAYVTDIDARHARMVWTHPGMSTYYRNSRGRVVVPTPYRVIDFWNHTRKARLEQFHVARHELERVPARP